MLIDLQTRSRWRITISSPHHGIADQSARPGACPFVSRSGDHSCFFSTPPPRPYPNDTCPLRDGERNPRRRNSFWNFCRLLKEIRQMCSHRCPPISPGESQPPDAGSYDISYMGGSPGTATELPATPLLEAAELDNHQYEDSNLPYNTGGMQGGYLNHEYPMSLEHVEPQTLERTDTTVFPLGLDNHQTSGSVPSLTSGYQSSPVSSLNTDIFADLPLQSYGDFQKGSESSVNTLSPFQHSWTRTNEMGMEQHGASQDDRVPLAMMNPTQASVASAGGSHSSHPAFQRDSYVEHAPWPTRDAGSTASLSMQSSPAFALPQSRGLESIRLGVYEKDPENGWLYRPLNGLERGNANVAIRSTTGVSPWQFSSQADGQQRPKTYVEHHDHTYPEVVECKCSECGKPFHGKYCNTNMKRHVRAIHKDTARTQCGICGDWFNRSDAVLKHGREKHNLPPAKPKRRANS